MNEKKLSLYIFGTGLSTSALYPALLPDMCNIIAFIDERPHTWTTQYMSYPVIGIKDMHIEQCDYLFIMCHGAKDVANRLNKDYAIPQEKIVIFDFFEKNAINFTEKNNLELPSDTMKRYLVDAEKYITLYNI